MANIFEYYIVVDPNEIERVLLQIDGTNPFSYKSEFKEYRKRYSDKDKAIINLAKMVKEELKYINKSNILYTSKDNLQILILKFRMKDDSRNSGKSDGYRVIALDDQENSILYVLSLYKHSQGKANISDYEKNAIKKLCEIYAQSIK